MSALLTKTALGELIERLLADGKRVAGPRPVKENLVQYGWLASADELTLEGWIRPANSIKEFVFPRHEALYGYRIAGRQVELTACEPPTAEQVIIAARPCDAAGLAALDRVFNWDSQDEFYNRRRELTTVVTLACRDYDAHCFCTSVGLGPADPRGSDALLVAVDDDRYVVRCLTDKGRRLFAGLGAEVPDEVRLLDGPPPQFDLAAIRTFLAGGYEHQLWQAAALRCLGCAVCAYTCPTCHCFDIVDEGGPTGGTRVRNWDACQFARFTAHASGHNPRHDQGQRQRQRIYHKFQIYPEKFGPLLCTGCGNCSRNCPAGLGVLPVLKLIGATP